jgi:hypothetical protein
MVNADKLIFLAIYWMFRLLLLYLFAVKQWAAEASQRIRNNTGVCPCCPFLQALHGEQACQYCSVCIKI